MKLFKGNIELTGYYELLVTESAIHILDNRGNVIYMESAKGRWMHDTYGKDGTRLERRSNINNHNEIKDLKGH